MGSGEPGAVARRESAVDGPMPPTVAKTVGGASAEQVGVDRSSISHRLARPTLALLSATAVLLLAVLIASFGGAADLPLAGTAAALLDELPFVHITTGLTPVQQGVLDQI